MSVVDELAHRILRDGLRRAFGSVRWLLDDVDDRDWFWEPTTPCWSVRRREDAAPGWGTGEWVCENPFPPPRPLPVTSIAWRAAHLAGWTEVYRAWTFDDTRTNIWDLEIPGSRDGVVEWVHAAQDRFARSVDELAPEQLTVLRPAHWGADLPIHALVATISYEHVHHGAEIGALRDIRRGHARLQPPPS